MGFLVVCEYAFLVRASDESETGFSLLVFVQFPPTPTPWNCDNWQQQEQQKQQAQQQKQQQQR